MRFSIADFGLVFFALAVVSVAIFLVVRRWMARPYAAAIGVVAGWTVLSIGGGLVGAAMSPDAPRVADTVRDAMIAYALPALALLGLALVLARRTTVRDTRSAGAGMGAANGDAASAGDGDWDVVRAERDDVLPRALGLPLADAVYALVRYNETRWPSSLFVLDLAELLSLGSAAELGQWEAKSRRLRAGAYAVRDAGLQGDGSFDEVRATFVADHPGFGERSYEDAISLGYRQAR